MSTHTKFESVNLLLDQLAQNVERILGSNFIGCYLFGSLAVGDFDPATSDVDILVVSLHNLNPSEVEQLSDFHKTLFQSKTAFSTELECFYASKNELQNFVQGSSICYKIDRGSGGLALETLDADWVINAFSLLNFGITVMGPPVSSLIAPVSIENLKSAVQDLLEFWWVPMISEPKKLEHAGYRFYAILTMTRMLATAELNQIVSKNEAAKYALMILDERWKQLIQKALNRDASGSISETQDFIRFTREKLTN